MRKPIIAANWKMYKTIGEMSQFCDEFISLVANNDYADIVLCAPFTMLAQLSERLKGTNIGLGAQNFYPAKEGAYTGEISLAMLQEIGVQYIVIGHSERRQIFGEQEELIKEKLAMAFAEGFQPILCVGETLEQREANQSVKVCINQVASAIEGLSKEQVEKLVIAYEPIWAIGTGKTATAFDAEQVIKEIRQFLLEKMGEEVQSKVRIQYGGSVKPQNIKELMKQPNIDGVLVGGASLQAESFASISNYKE